MSDNVTLSAEDRLAIAELLARYNYAFDSGDAAGWAECFTEDGVFEGPRGRLEGSEALERYAADAVQRGTIRHFVGNVLIEADEFDHTKATVKSYLIYYEVGAPPAPQFSVKTTAIQIDHVVKSTGKWRIRERRATADAPKLKP